MAAYIRELCRMYVGSKLDVIIRVDIENGIKNLLDTKQITIHHVDIAWKYICGYSFNELSEVYGNAEVLLKEFFTLLEIETGYTDEQLVRLGLYLFPTYREHSGLMRSKINAYGMTFT